jgi:hypothetical protein
MSKVISKIINITTPIMPPDVEFIEKEIEKQGIEALRWAIVDIKQNELKISVSGRNINVD